MISTIERLASGLAGRYRVTRELGAGGMATVYLAQDLKHERDVAVKVLHQDLGASLGAERFLAEIKTTAKLQHPHVLPLLDSGAAEGLLYYVMPFVDGESLGARMTREKRLPVADALRIATQVADALEYAHRLGVVHRDIKPENILLRDGFALVADFGIAMSSTSVALRLTQAGMALGTPAYMSPEQFLGDSPLDGRSDLYSLGCVLYEMLTGEAPFQAANAQAMLAQRLLHDAPRVRAKRDDVPAMVELLLARALAREASDRHASVGEFGAALHAELSGATSVGRGTATAREDTPFRLPGRTRELADAMDMVERLVTGHGGVLLLAGEPGVGKTRLANTILSAARARGALALTGRCYEMEGTPPFTPFAEVLDYVTRLVPSHTFREVLGDAAPEIARVQPLLRQVFPDIPEPLDLPPERVRPYLHAQYRAFSERATRVTPQVILLDDLHWADDASLALLEYLASAVAEIPLLFIGTYRDVDLDVSRPFAATLERLTRQRLARRIAVKRLTTDGVAEQLAVLGGSAPPSALVALLHAETDGNPFFVEEVFQHLREEGRLFDTQGEWRTDLGPEDLEVPEGVRLVIGKRIERLGDACRAVLTSAAIIGPRFTVPVLTALGDVDEEALLDELDRAAHAKLIDEERGSREGAYRFSHELIRQTLLSVVSTPRRQRRHLRIAEAIERLAGDRATQSASDLAFHLYQAGGLADPHTTSRWLVEAAWQAHDKGAVMETLQHCDRAASIEEVDDPHLLAEIDRARGSAYHAMGRWGDAIECYRKGFERILTVPDAVPHVALVMDLCALTSWSGYQATASHLARRALERVPEGTTQARAMLAAAAGGFRAVGEGQFSDGLPMILDAREMATRIGDSEARAMSDVMESFVYLNLGLMDRNVVASERTLQHLDMRRQRRLYDETQGGRMIGLLYSGRLDRWHAERAHAQATAVETSYVGSLLILDGTGGEVDYLARGNFDEFIAHCGAHRERWAVAGPYTELTTAYEGLAQLAHGDSARALATCEGARKRFPVNSWQGLIEGAELLVAAHVSDEAWQSRFAQWRHLLVGTDDGPGIGRSIFTYRAAQGHFVRRDLSALAALYPPLCAVMARGHRYGTDMAVGGIAAAAACAAGHLEEAVQLGEEAVRLWTDQPHVLLRAHSEWMLGWVLSQRDAAGDRERANVLLERAEKAYLRCGAITYAGSVRA